MAKEQSNDMMKMAGAAMVGAVAGAVTAAMLTPKSGRELRSSLHGKAKELGTKAKGKAEDLTE